MKLNFLIMAAIMLGLSVVTASAMQMPHPIYGHILSSDSPVANAEIIVLNTNSQIKSTTFTNSNGFYQVDLGNVDPNYREGDVIKVSLAYCSNLELCSKSVAVSSGGNLISWDIANIESPIPDTIQVLEYVCESGEKVSSLDKCPKPIPPQPEVITTYVCADGNVVSRLEDCPEQSSSWWLWIVGILATFLIGTGGWKFYNGKFKHYHKGLNSYHDPNAQHSNPKYRHAAWKENPLKCMSDVRKIEKGIDLSVKENV